MELAGTLGIDPLPGPQAKKETAPAARQMIGRAWSRTENFRVEDSL